ncbi:MAG: hypothetical protein HYV27_13615 [Candidatus Hydrogenedentes bacterium]|nr:hypothetical protein [Candidatus Hydrogenedentota bacterium]
MSTTQDKVFQMVYNALAILAFILLITPFYEQSWGNGATIVVLSFLFNVLAKLHSMSVTIKALASDVERLTQARNVPSNSDA